MKQWKSIICEADEGKTLEEILKAAGFSRKEISRQKFIPDGITLDGQKCRVTTQVHIGQLVVLNFREKEEEKKAVPENEKNGQEAGITILYRQTMAAEAGRNTSENLLCLGSRASQVSRRRR